MPALPEPFEPWRYMDDVPTVEALSLPVGIPAFTGLTLWEVAKHRWQASVQTDKGSNFTVAFGNTPNAAINACMVMRFGA